MRGEQKRHRTKSVPRFTCGGDEGKSAHSLRESATAAAPPGALRAPLANAPRFRSYAPCRVRFPCAGNKKGTEQSRCLDLPVVETKGSPRIRSANPRPLRRLPAPCALRWQTLRVSAATRPVGFDSRARGTKKAPNKVGASIYLWWRRRESNPRPLPCDGSALPAELRPQAKEYSTEKSPSVKCVFRAIVTRTIVQHQRA